MTDIVDTIADKLLEDHMQLMMAENNSLREQLAACEKERDELVAALNNIAEYEHPFCTTPQDLQEIATAALAKLDADKGEK